MKKGPYRVRRGDSYAGVAERPPPSWVTLILIGHYNNEITEHSPRRVDGTRIM